MNHGALTLDRLVRVSDDQESSTGAPAPAKRGRPRQAGKNEQILGAAQQLLAECGFAAFTMDAVATRVGASKATIYRRWASRTQLLAEAINTLEWSAKAPDTGSLRADLIALADVWFAEDPQRDAIFVNLLAALPQDDTLHELYISKLAGPRAELVKQVLDQAAARGELATTAAVERTRGIIPGLVFHRLAVERLPVDRAYITSLIDHVVLPVLQRCAINA